MSVLSDTKLVGAILEEVLHKLRRCEVEIGDPTILSADSAESEERLKRVRVDLLEAQKSLQRSLDVLL